MQKVIHVFSKQSASLREIIVNHPMLSEYGLKVKYSRLSQRSQGWAKLESLEPSTTPRDYPGVIMISWDAQSRTLTCRVNTHTRGPQFDLIGSFINFLLAALSRKIVDIRIQP
jgi:hypothetical protein